MIFKVLNFYTPKVKWAGDNSLSAGKNIFQIIFQTSKL